MSANPRLLVALSGGVDSAVAACLLHEAGHPLVGVFMRNGVVGAAGSRSCCSLSDARDARAVADGLGVPFYVQDLSQGFSRLIEGFARDYAAGRTPNPCIVCNNDLKFGELADLAADLGCDGVATGHYARVVDGALLRAVDREKDQSYLLHGLTREQLALARFPLGGLTKEQVRQEAARRGLGVAAKPDSADICFVPGGDYRAVVRERLGALGAPGAVVDDQGGQVASHDGVGAFTVGQRRGLGVALGRPAYVTDIDPEGTVRVGDAAGLEREQARVEGMHWLAEPPGPEEEVLVQLRHHHRPESVTLGQDASGTWQLRFLRPTRAVSPGQYAVVYRGEQVLGGGRLLRPGTP